MNRADREDLDDSRHVLCSCQSQWTPHSNLPFISNIISYKVLLTSQVGLFGLSCPRKGLSRKSSSKIIPCALAQVQNGYSQDKNSMEDGTVNSIYLDDSRTRTSRTSIKSVLPWQVILHTKEEIRL